MLRAQTADGAARYRVEPYVLAGDIYSCVAVGRSRRLELVHGRGGVDVAARRRSESSGCAGKRAQLLIDPCIPPQWKGFEAWLTAGQQRYHVVVDNPVHVARGVAWLALDGAELASNRIEVDPSATGAHEVQVRLGPGPTSR